MQSGEHCAYWPACNCGLTKCPATHAPVLADVQVHLDPIQEIKNGLTHIIALLEQLKVGVEAIDTKQDTVWNGQHLLVQEIQALGEKIALLGATGYSRRKGSEFRFGDDNGAGG
jgi:phosphoserine phosphatase